MSYVQPAQFPEHRWFKSSYTTNSGVCVEVAMTSDAVGVRDTKNRAGGHFTVSADQWQAFIDKIKSGDYDQ